MQKALFLTVPLGLLLWLYSSKTGKADLPRGIRNNNAGNIEYNTTKWQGLIGSDGRFCIFDTPENGIRALGKVLLTYRNSYGIDSVEAILNRYAPSVENDTQSYVNHVADKVGVSAKAPLSIDDYPALIEAIILHENGQQPYSQDLILTGWRNALA
ncbi:hypothetical protein AAOGI_06770 [Agarivorans albus]